MTDRPGVRYPKFKEHFSVLDFSQEREAFCISLYPMPPALPREKTEISFCGMDSKMKTLHWNDLASLPRIKIKSALICQIFNCSVRVVWEGWRLKTILELAGISAKQNRYYAFYSRDSMYFESLNYKDAMDERTLVVCGMNGKELPHEHGGSVRLAVPFLQGYKSVKWLCGIRTFQNDPMGIKILLAQSKSGKLSPEWKKKYGIGPLEGYVVKAR